MVHNLFNILTACLNDKVPILPYYFLMADSFIRDATFECPSLFLGNTINCIMTNLHTLVVIC